jgi:hypothetical protein
MIPNAVRKMRWGVCNVSAAFALGFAATVPAADFPVKPIRFLVGVAPGGGTDFMARLVGQKLNEAWGQPVVVDNRIGATGLIAMEMLAKSTPDGYTLIVFNVGHMMSAHLARKVAFDPVRICARQPHGQRDEHARNSSLDTSQIRARVHRFCEGAAGEDQLCFRRVWRHPAPRHRAAEA